MSIDISEQLRNILDDYVDDIKEVTNEVIDKVAKESRDKLKATSPKRTGKYAKNWSVKKEYGRNGIATVTVHNKKTYRLTHLLEKGHVIKNKYGEYGRVPAQKHIEPVEEWAIKETVQEIERNLK